MTFSSLDNLLISPEKQGPVNIKKNSFPLRYGKYAEIKTAQYEFRFNLNGEIKFIRGLNVNWPHPAEQLKRTDGNDWVYYSVGDQSGHNGIISWLGEYYLPCLPYPSNCTWDLNYYTNPNIMNAFAAWSQLYADLYGAGRNGLHPKLNNLVTRILDHDDRVLFERSQRLGAIVGQRPSVLPPDTRHVDYEIIPLNIVDGCLYRCKFCCVKSNQPFKVRSESDIFAQIQQLKDFYGRNLVNYNALFLGNHDALAAGVDVICQTALNAHKAFDCWRQRSTVPLLYLFGSVNSFLNLDRGALEKMNHLPFYTYVNIGFESIDQPTLAAIGKPVKDDQVHAAFQKMLEINAAYSNIEVTGNFIIGEQLCFEHYHSLTELLENAAVRTPGKGAVYLSPLKDSPKKRELLPMFYKIKAGSHLPVYMYLIQRL